MMTIIEQHDGQSTLPGLDISKQTIHARERETSYRLENTNSQSRHHSWRENSLHHKLTLGRHNPRTLRGLYL